MRATECGDVSLKCPVCDFDYLHQIRYVAFSPYGEDNEEGVYLYHDVETKEVLTAKKDLGGVRTYRRQGLSIYFFCEGCHNISRLDILQKKGQTEVEWFDVENNEPLVNSKLVQL
jgi:hypothetical protein